MFLCMRGYLCIAKEHCREISELAVTELASEAMEQWWLYAVPATALLSGCTATLRAKYKTHLFTILH